MGTAVGAGQLLRQSGAAVTSSDRKPFFANNQRGVFDEQMHIFIGLSSGQPLRILIALPLATAGRWRRHGDGRVRRVRPMRRRVAY
jgi:5-enolpyruvylshikimate-3-phosphate synthase